jgi:20S proteasome subunit beta 7
MRKGREPIVTGASVIGIKYKDGVMLCADCQACYGSSRKFKGFSRLARVNDKTALGTGSLTSCIAATGEMSDFQAIVEFFQEKSLTDETQEDGTSFLTASHYAAYLSTNFCDPYRRMDLSPTTSHGPAVQHHACGWVRC